ncbi:MAG: hypothetical protein ACQEXJ_24460, partial [Myxococcota bacterium]
KNAPRRTYDLSRQTVIDGFPEGTTVRCPTAEEREACEQGGDFFGVPLEGEIISRECDGRPGECTFESDDTCADGIASDGLPPSLRIYADFMWQRSPFEIGYSTGLEGGKQSPGRDLSEPYWMARFYDYITAGDGQVLAWEDVGACD